MDTMIKSAGTPTVTEGVLPDGVPYVRVTGVYPFDAEQTFLCGQCFRFDPASPEFPEIFESDTVYGGVALGKYINVSSPDLDTVVIEGVTAEEFDEVWSPYFGFDMDYAGIIRDVAARWGEDSRIAEAARAGRGIRLLRQDPWETLCSFIISQNNNIPRIKGIIDKLSRRYGVPFFFRDEEKFAFPTARVLFEADADGIGETRMGFRAKYVYGAAERTALDGGFLDSIASAGSYEEADEILRSLRGVGPKVSACTLLFGFCRYEAFPVDVWIRRTVGKYFDGARPDEIDFGPLAPVAGILQQYIFNYERNLNGGE